MTPIAFRCEPKRICLNNAKLVSLEICSNDELLQVLQRREMFVTFVQKLRTKHINSSFGHSARDCNRVSVKTNLIIFHHNGHNGYFFLKLRWKHDLPQTRFWVSIEERPCKAIQRTPIFIPCVLKWNEWLVSGVSEAEKMTLQNNVLKREPVGFVSFAKQGTDSKKRQYKFSVYFHSFSLIYWSHIHIHFIWLKPGKRQE